MFAQTLQTTRIIAKYRYFATDQVVVIPPLTHIRPQYAIRTNTVKFACFSLIS